MFFLFSIEDFSISQSETDFIFQSELQVNQLSNSEQRRQYQIRRGSAFDSDF